MEGNMSKHTNHRDPVKKVSVSQNFLTNRKLRFMGKNRETMPSLFLKPGWNTEIAWHFRRSDFHPMPAVDCVLLHLARKKSPDLNKKEYREFRHFVEHSMKYGLFGKQSLLTRKQINTALKREKLPPLTPGGEILYIQWLCLFRCYTG